MAGTSRVRAVARREHGGRADRALLLLPVLALLLPGVAAAAPPAGGWQWPVDPPRSVVRPFAPGATRYSAGHLGADLGAVVGAAVRSVGPGRVSYSGVLAGRGVVVVEHPGGLRTTYEPLDRAVRLGQPVQTGTLLGRLTSGHPCPRPCLHLGLRRGADYLDPMSLFEGPVRLLPEDGRRGAGRGSGRGAGSAGGRVPGQVARAGAATSGDSRGAAAPRDGGLPVPPSAGPPPTAATAARVRAVAADRAPWERLTHGAPGSALAVGLLAVGLVLVRRPAPPGPCGGSGGVAPEAPAGAEPAPRAAGPVPLHVPDDDGWSPGPSGAVGAGGLPGGRVRASSTVDDVPRAPAGQSRPRPGAARDDEGHGAAARAPGTLPEGEDSAPYRRPGADVVALDVWRARRSG